MTAYHPHMLLVGRVLMSLMYIISGWGKIAGYAGTQGYMQAFGVPGALLPLVILVELVGGILLLIGYQTRWAALALAAFTILAALIFHTAWSDQMQMISFMKNVTITGGFLALAAAGAGALSLDNRAR